jgi:hypothetical protein
MTLPAVSKHLRVLQRAGLIEQGRRAQERPCRLAAGPLKDAADWIEQYRHHWEESFERLGEYLRELKELKKRGGPGPHEAPRHRSRRGARRIERQRRKQGRTNGTRKANR